mgnify:CR=1 FL=1
MLQWLNRRDWLPEILLTLGFSSVAFLFDYFGRELTAGLWATLLAASVFFFRRFSYVAVATIPLFTLLEIPLGHLPLFSGGLVPFVLFLMAIYAERRWSMLAAATAMASGLLLALHSAFEMPLQRNLYGLSIIDDSGRLSVFVFAAITVVGVNLAAWLLGGYVAERSSHTGASRERDTALAIQTRTAIDIAEQNEKFQIARDLNELLLQQVSGLLSLTDGARYAAKVDASVASRTLDRVVALVRGIHGEMRRLYDMLNGTVKVAAAPPNLDDLGAVAISFRGLGYNAKLSHHGNRVRLSPTAELSIFRIVFEALENVRAHAPIGTDVDVDFTWSSQGLQVLVKDNGLEVAQKSAVDASASEPGYTATEDLQALTRQVDGPTIAGMRERAALFQGSIEAKFVPGVGFTLSAIFPDIYDFAAEVSN